MSDDDLDDLDETALFRQIVAELRALRRLVGTLFIVAVVLVVLLPLLTLVWR